MTAIAAVTAVACGGADQAAETKPGSGTFASLATQSLSKIDGSVEVPGLRSAARRARWRSRKCERHRRGVPADNRLFGPGQVPRHHRPWNLRATGRPFYGNLLEAWARGEFFPLAFTRPAVDKEAKHTLMLKPAARAATH
jgi:hypothetical protein